MRTIIIIAESNECFNIRIRKQYDEDPSDDSYDDYVRKYKERSRNKERSKTRERDYDYTYNYMV
jgi:hypothetical protein